MQKQKALFYKLSRSKAPKHCNLGLQTLEKTSKLFYGTAQESTLASAIILLT